MRPEIRLQSDPTALTTGVHEPLAGGVQIRQLSDLQGQHEPKSNLDLRDHTRREAAHTFRQKDAIQRQKLRDIHYRIAR
jgi:hypothetical protein